MATATTRPRKDARQPHGVARLTLCINGTAYGVKPVRCDSEAAVRCFALRKADGTVYHASQHTYGCECTCPDWVFHRDGRDPRGCKHLVSLTACGLLDG